MEESIDNRTAIPRLYWWCGFGEESLSTSKLPHDGHDSQYEQRVSLINEITTASVSSSIVKGICVNNFIR